MSNLKDKESRLAGNTTFHLNINSPEGHAEWERLIDQVCPPGYRELISPLLLRLWVSYDTIQRLRK